MRDHDDAARIRCQVILKPVARLDVEMVGRLVEHQELGLLQQQLGQRDAHPDAAGEFRDIAMKIAVAEAQAKQDRSARLSAV